MTKRQLFSLLRDVPQDADIRLSDNVAVTSVKVQQVGRTVVVWLGDSEEGETER